MAVLIIPCFNPIHHAGSDTEHRDMALFIKKRLAPPLSSIVLKYKADIKKYELQML